jgi:ADP-ribosylglycohydrolase
MSVDTQRTAPGIPPPISTRAVSDEAAARRYRRTWGCLAGLVYGDARGKPFSFFSRPQIAEVYGDDLEWPVPVQATPEKRCWMRYEASDDTFQTLCLARSLIARRRLDPADVAARLAELPGRYASSQSAIQAVRRRLRGEDVPLPSRGTSAAMRVPPVPLVYFDLDLPDLVDAVAAASSVSHSARSPIAAAAAVAGFVHAALRDEGVEAAVDAALEACALADRYGEDDGREPLVDVVRRALERADGDLGRLLPGNLDEGNRAWNVMPVAFAIVWRHRRHLGVADAVREAVLLGADADTQGAIVGCMAGSANPDSIPEAEMDRIEDRNSFRVADVAVELWRMGVRPSAAGSMAPS